jgi:hypothetical protein
LTILRVVAENAATSLETRAFLLARCIKHPDDELVRILAARMPVKTVVDVLEGTAIKVPMGVLATNVRDRVNALVGLSFPNVVNADALAEQTLKTIAHGVVEGIGLDEAIALVAPTLEPKSIAFALSESKIPLTVDQARWLLEDYPGYRSITPNLTVQAARLLARDGSPQLKVAAVEAHHTDLHTVKHAMKCDSVDVFEALAGYVTRPEAVRVLVDRLIAKRETVIDTNRYRSYRFAKSAAEVLLRRGMCPDDLVVPLLRSDHIDTTKEWLRGRYNCVPQPGQLSELAASPGRAFTDCFEHESRASFFDAVDCGDISRAEFSAASRLPWAVEFLENAPGIMKVCGEYYADSTMVSYVYDRLHGAFGDDGRLWRLALNLAPGSVGTISEFIKLVAASSVEPVTGTITVDPTAWTHPSEPAS